MKSKASVNLLSPSYVAKRNATRALKQWSIVSGVGLLLVSLWIGSEYYSLQRANDRLAYAKVEHGKQKDAKTEIDKLTERRNVLEQREQSTLELDDDVPLVDLIGIVSQAAGNSNGQIHLETFKYGLAATTGKRNASSADRNLKLVGVALDNVAIARFAAAIRDAKVFDSVELASTGPANGTTDTSHRSFDIQCTFAAGGNLR